MEGDYGGKLSEPACRKTLNKKNPMIINKNYLYHIPYFIFIEKRDRSRKGEWRGREGGDEIFVWTSEGCVIEKGRFLRF